jgi:protein dithiol oxidoreductase (disulfide-forming)
MSESPRRRELLAALCASPALWLAPEGRAQAPSIPQEGSEFTVLSSPQPTDPPGKIEVLDFFWYGCPHCYAFLPELEAWRKRLASDVAFKHVPVTLNPGTEAHTKIFYALQSLGKVDELHIKVFDALQIKRMRMLDTDEIADFMAANGIARDKWLAAFNSFSVAGGLNRARLTARAYLVDSTPTLACDGRFVTSPAMGHSYSPGGVLGVMDYLLDRARRDHALRKS